MSRKGRTKNSPGGGYKDVQGHAYSDSEADIGFRNYNYNAFLPTVSEDGKRRGGYERLTADYGNLTDLEEDDGARSSANSLDEFGEREQHNVANRLVRTGRQRKKLAARSKGGEFRQRRKKRRLYFCCVSSEIDVQKLFDYLVGAGSLLNGWKYQLHADVLHLYKPGVEEPAPIRSRPGGTKAYDHTFDENQYSATGGVLESMDVDDGDKGIELEDVHRDPSLTRVGSLGVDDDVMRDAALKAREMAGGIGNGNDDPSRISVIGAQEVFVFDFGAAVFWGFSRGEETNLLKTIRMFVTKGFVGSHEFQSGLSVCHTRSLSLPHRRSIIPHTRLFSELTPSTLLPFDPPVTLSLSSLTHPPTTVTPTHPPTTVTPTHPPTTQERTTWPSSLHPRLKPSPSPTTSSPCPTTPPPSNE